MPPIGARRHMHDDRHSASQFCARQINKTHGLLLLLLLLLPQALFVLLCSGRFWSLEREGGGSCDRPSRLPALHTYQPSQSRWPFLITVMDRKSRDRRVSRRILQMGRGFIYSSASVSNHSPFLLIPSLFCFSFLSFFFIYLCMSF
ncbi:hypothetical protein F4859DRAFT_471980 [Xylaria cf. heliscus]|nr:hypothetical protein F4859DRAFT_471980 [Xylaria cf. heliscus]